MPPTVAGDVVSVHVDRSSADVHSAMALLGAGGKLTRVVVLLRRAQGELAKAELEVLRRVDDLPHARRRAKR